MYIFLVPTYLQPINCFHPLHVFVCFCTYPRSHGENMQTPYRKALWPTPPFLGCGHRRRRIVWDTPSAPPGGIWTQNLPAVRRRGTRLSNRGFFKCFPNYKQLHTQQVLHIKYTLKPIFCALLIKSKLITGSTIVKEYLCVTEYLYEEDSLLSSIIPQFTFH